MVDSKSKDENATTTRSIELDNLYDRVKQNYIRIVEEIYKSSTAIYTIRL
jgi:hypothetical protein